jgi:hypothetical protein
MVHMPVKALMPASVIETASVATMVVGSSPAITGATATTVASDEVALGTASDMSMGTAATVSVEGVVAGSGAMVASSALVIVVALDEIGSSAVTGSTV